MMTAATRQSIDRLQDEIDSMTKAERRKHAMRLTEKIRESKKAELGEWAQLLVLNGAQPSVAAAFLALVVEMRGLGVKLLPPGAH